VFDTAPSLAPDEYDNSNAGLNPPGTTGAGNGYDHENSPVLPPADHELDGFNDVAE